jgi:hypothetical protein
MRFLTLDEWVASRAPRDRTLTSVELEVPIDQDRFWQELPPAALVRPLAAHFGREHFWHLQTTSAHIAMELSEGTSREDFACLCTFGAMMIRWQYPWEALTELECLPSSILLSRLHSFAHEPTGATSSKYFVYRPNSTEVPRRIYRAASMEDARGLIDYLERDPWNRGLFLGPEYFNWIVNRKTDAGVIEVGRYPRRDFALQVARQHSSVGGSRCFVVYYDEGGTLLHEFQSGVAIGTKSEP